MKTYYRYYIGKSLSLWYSDIRVLRRDVLQVVRDYNIKGYVYVEKSQDDTIERFAQGSCNGCNVTWRYVNEF